MADVTKTVLTKFEGDSKDYDKAADNVEQSNQDMAKSSEDYTEASEAMNGVLGDTLSSLGIMPAAGGKASKAMGIMTKSLKSFKLALIATGLGIFLVALGALVTYFKSSEEGQNSLNKIMRVMGVIVGNLSDVVANLGEAIFNAFANPMDTIKAVGDAIKTNIQNRIDALISIGPAITKIFSKDWKEGFADLGEAAVQFSTGIEDLGGKIQRGFEGAKNALGEFTDEMKKEIKLGQQLADLEAKTNKLERQFWVEQAEANARIADLRLKARQEEQFSAAERLKFAEQARVEVEDLAEKEIAIAKNRLDARLLENSFSKSTKENLDEAARLEAEMSQIQATRAQMQKGLEREIITIRKQAATAEAAIVKEKETAEKARVAEKQAELDAIAEAQAEIDAAIDERYQVGIDNTVAQEKRELERVKKVAEAEKIAQESAIQLENDKQSAAIAGFQLLGALGEENAALSKAVTIAESLYRGYLAIINAWAMPDVNIFTKLATVAIVTANVIALIAKVKSSSTFMQGGFVPEGGGIAHGRGHIHGGIKFKLGGRAHEMQGGEFVINREATSKNMALLSKINASGHYQTGGLVGVSPSSAAVFANQVSGLQTAFENQQTVLVTEDLDEVQNRIEVTEDRSSL